MQKKKNHNTEIGIALLLLLFILGSLFYTGVLDITGFGGSIGGGGSPTTTTVATSTTLADEEEGGATTTTIPCYDSDGGAFGKQEYFTGACTDTDATIYDYCENPSVVGEAICQEDGTCTYESIVCPDGFECGYNIGQIAFCEDLGANP
jgi:hypothetical protein